MHSGTALIDHHIVFDKVKLKSGYRVADLGCGRTGHFVFPAAKVVGDTGQVYAVDIVKDILETISSRVRRQGFSNVLTVWSDIEMAGKTSIPKESLDVCFVTNVMFLVKDKKAAIKEAARLLAKDGLMVITEWAKKLGPLGPETEQLVAPDFFLELGPAVGLKFIEKFNPGDYHYSLIFKKNSKKNNSLTP
jgi:ubiquinone/menaquinone biosynthesis C-methylase UbiE